MRALFVLFALPLAGAAAAQSLYSSATVQTLGLGGTNSVTDDSTVTRSDTIGALAGSGSARSEYGALHATAYGINSGGTDFAYTQGFASSSDLLTIAGGVGDDYYLVDYLVSGIVSSTGTASVRADLLWPNLPNGTGGLTTGTYTVAGVFPVKFTYGVAFSFGTELYAGVTFNAGRVGEGWADFNRTATLSAIHIVDKNGNVVGPRAVSAASGHVYPQPVPEPASLAALGLGAAALLRGQRRKRR